MIRGILILVALAAVVAAAFVLAGEPGRASVEWLGWRVDMTAAAAALTIIIGAFLAVGLWRLALWIVETPRRHAQQAGELAPDAPALVRILAAQAAEAAGDPAAAQAAYHAMLGFPEMR